MVDVRNIRKSICIVGRLLFDRGLTDSSGGNISVRDNDKIYITPKSSGFDYQWSLEEDQIIVTDLCKMPISGDPENVSRESATHYYIYQNFPEVNAIIHAHSGISYPSKLKSFSLWGRYNSFKNCIWD